MCAVNLEEDQHLSTTRVHINDFAIVAATVNGSGSQTANSTLMRAMFKMGIPVSGKNLFPSNIYGLPTWYSIRLSKNGYTARRSDYHILAALNPRTQAEDIKNLAPGGICIYPDEWKLASMRDDILYYPVPVKQMAKDSGASAALREYVANMVYVGALAELLGIDLIEVKNALDYNFQGKAKAVNLNYSVVEMAAAFAREHFADLPSPCRVEHMEATQGKILIDGNAAAALGAVFGGVSVVAWYPITPSTSLIDSLNEYVKELRTDPSTGETTCAVVQAEDELAAIGMVIGAGWVGARSMTATSGPGLSLMGEFAGLAYFAEIPAVIWDVQRMGPSTGLPTRTSQGDVLKAYYLSHGDTRHVCLLPGSMAECFEFGWRAFDLAERLQTLVICLSDLDMGMNHWMSDQFEYPDTPMDRGKLFTNEDLQRLGKFARYKDVDGDGVGYRSLPGQGPAYFVRGTGHNEMAVYSERADDWENNLKRLDRKHNTARQLVPQPITQDADDAAIGIIGFGSNDPAIKEALDLLTEAGISSAYQRIRALPLGQATREFLDSYDRVYVVESNDLGQMASLLRMEYPELANRIISAAHCDGLSLTARWIADTIMEKEHQS
jgi:2-oxoglutarate ferredoxin oxidoreductase subunit alpha